MLLLKPPQIEIVFVKVAKALQVQARTKQITKSRSLVTVDRLCQEMPNLALMLKEW